MSQLARQQGQFFAAAFGPAGAAAAAEESVAALLQRSPLRGARRAAEIYRETCLTRDLGELAHAFPLLARGLGEDAFAATCRAYLADILPRRSPLARLGAELPAFLERVGRPRAWVDLAALEDMRAAVFAAPDSLPASASALAGARGGADHARLFFVPSMRRRPATSCLATLAREPEALLRLSAAPPQPAALVVWRAGLDVLHTRLEGDAAAALALAMGGATFAVVCGAFASAPAPTTAALAAVGSWFADGWVARVG